MPQRSVIAQKIKGLNPLKSGYVSLWLFYFLYEASYLLTLLHTKTINCNVT